MEDCNFSTGKRQAEDMVEVLCPGNAPQCPAGL